MAQAGFTPISLYYSTTAAAVPSSGNLVAGELALNTVDEKLYFKNSAGTVKLLASSSATTPVTTISFGSTGLTPSTATSGAVTVAGTLAVANGGTGLTTTPANGALDIGNGTGFTRATLTAGTGVTITNSSGGITIAATGSGGTVTDVTATSPVASTGGTTPVISLSANYGDTLNPYASKTANFFLAAPNGSSGAPTFRAIVAADIPTLNQNTTGNAANVTGIVAVANGGTGASTLTANNVILGNGTSAVQFVAPGSNGNILTSNGTTWTSAAASSGGDSFTAIASGTISNGRMVNLKNDGTVEMVAETTVVTPDSIPAGSATQFNSGTAATRFSVAWANNSSTKFILVYYDTVNTQGEAVLGTVSGSTITFGSVSLITSSGQPFEAPSVCANPANSTTFVIVWRGLNERGRSVVATISGNNLSIGTEYIIPTATSVYAPCVATVWGSASSVVVSYFDNSNGNYITLTAGTVSGNDVTWGARTVVEANDALGATSVACSPFDNNSTGVVIFRRNSNGNGYGKCFSVSGTNITVQASVATWNAGNTANSDYDNNGMFISSSWNTSATYAVVNRDQTTSYGVIYGATTNFSVPNFANGLTFESNALTSLNPRVGFSKFSPSKLVVSYAISSATYAYSMTMSGNTVTLGTKNTVYAGTSISVAVGFSNATANDKDLVMAYRGASNVPFAVIGTIGFSTTTNNLSSTLFVGASAGDYTNGQTATVLVKGAVSTAQAGLTVNSTYYLQTNGTLSTSPASPSVLAGRALAATKILVGTT
jgi:hypothetical protein